MLLKLITGSTAQARHESWKKRQFEAPHDGETAGAIRTKPSPADTEQPTRRGQRVSARCARRAKL